MSATPATVSALPRWDVTSFFSGLESKQFERAFTQAIEDIDELEALFDARGVGELVDSSGLDGARSAFDEVATRLNQVLEATWTVGAYLYTFIATDSRDQTAQARMSELRPHEARLSKLETRFTAWIGSVDVEDLIEQSTTARAHAFALWQAKETATHLMSRPEEELAADLDLSGATAWGKLHSDVTSQLAISFQLATGEREVAMSELRSLAHDADRDVRAGAYEAELRAWQRQAVPLAAALNSIKGQVNTLTVKRGWSSPLDEALFANRIDSATLDAMFSAVRETLPDLRRYLRAKARVLGVPKLAWYDIFAPVSLSAGGHGRGQWEFPEAENFIVEHFGRYSERMADYAARAFRERWIDAQPRVGKGDGAFCLFIKGGESRILTNYTPAYSGVSTLAHELGHGYHVLCLAGQTPLQRRTPMTLAETASIFCETIVRQAALAEAAPVEQLEILEGSLQDNVQVTVDTLSRFLFESRVFEGRKQRELSVEELCNEMLAAQRESYADGLDNDLLHPYMWAVKPHYYGERSFYNFPYTFGLLFGLGLYALYEEDAENFRTRYDDLLAATGSGSAADLAARFGIDIRTEDFWRASLGIIRKDIDRFERLVAA